MTKKYFDKDIIVDIKSVVKKYGDVRAVNGINTSIREGEFFSLLGPSGCGKTTLLRLISGFEHPDEGTVMIAGQDMTDVEPNFRPTNMVFQSYAIFPHLNVGENVGYGLKKQNLSDAELLKRVNVMLDLVDLKDYNNRPAYALSGGQRQRVALARALIMEPKVLLLDEPLSALDKQLRELMQVELRRLQRAVGITFVLVTHDQEEALTMSDRIAVMFDGNIAQLATPEELYKRPLNMRVGAFIGIMNFLEGRLEAISAKSLTVDVKGLGRVNIKPEQMPTPLAKGGVKIGIRPEMLTLLLDKNDTAEFEFNTTVLTASYYGDMTYYHVAMDGVENGLMVSMRNTAGRLVLKTGDKARIGWGAESLLVLK